MLGQELDFDHSCGSLPAHDVLSVSGSMMP